MMRIPPASMKRWMKMEDEHSKSPVRQRQIVIQHVREHGPHYYPYLIRMEAMLRKRYPVKH